MAGRSWDDPWRHYPASVPLPAEGGLASSKQRGPMAATWWSRRFTQVLESYGLGGRMQRGRRYARTGQVLTLDVQPGVLAAQVQGSRPRPYLITVQLPVPTAAQWATVEGAMSAKVGFVAHLLAGEVPAELEEVFSAAGVALFPRTWAEVRARCSCPDWENPCKHLAAVLYLFADRLDDDPWLLLAWRGREREEILGCLPGAARSPCGPGSEEVAPWWPWPPGRLADSALEGGAVVTGGGLRDGGLRDGGRCADVAPEHTDSVLDGLDVLDVRLGRSFLVEALRPVYGHIVDPGSG